MIRKAVRCTLLPLLVAAGCSTPPLGEVDAGAGADPLAAVPDDFSLDLTVRAGPEPDEGAVAPGDSLRPGHHVLFSDGSLHWAGGGADPGRGLPPQRRVLDQGQVAGLWSLLQSLGYSNPERGAAPVNAKLLEAAPGGTVSQCVITGDGRRWAFVSRQGPGQEPDPAMPMLIDYLDELAWATAPTGRAAEGPRRNEFGPDPYARFRRP
ncbi:MAG: hypothetical protein ACYTFF_07775 [Planctomycetota bacterium]|jgi:hypothetical protein